MPWSFKVTAPLKTKTRERGIVPHPMDCCYASIIGFPGRIRNGHFKKLHDFQIVLGVKGLPHCDMSFWKPEMNEKFCGMKKAVWHCTSRGVGKPFKMSKHIAEDNDALAVKGVILAEIPCRDKTSWYGILNFGQNPSRQFSYLHCLFPNFRTSKPPSRGFSTFLSSCISNANLNKQQISEAIRSCGACSNVQVPNPVSGSSPWRMACVTWTSSPVATAARKAKSPQLLLRNFIFTAALNMKTSGKTPPFNQATASGWQLSFNILTNQSWALVTCFHFEVDEIRKKQISQDAKATWTRPGPIGCWVGPRLVLDISPTQGK